MLRRLLVVLMSLLALLVVGFGVAIYLIDIPSLIEKYKPLALDAASKALNRKVEVAEVRPSWFPILGIHVEGIRIGDVPLTGSVPKRAKESSSLATLGSAEIGVAVWPALTSFGKDIHVSLIQLDRPQISVVRYADGTTNLDTIGASEETSNDPQPEPAPESETNLELIEGLRVEQIAIIDGTVSYEDHTSGGLKPVTIHKLGLRADDVGFGLPLNVAIQAAFEKETEPHVELSVVTKPLDIQLNPLVIPEPDALLDYIELKVTDLGLSVVPVETPTADLTQATLNTQVRIETNTEGQLTVRGPVQAQKLRILSKGQKPGALFDTKLDLRLVMPWSFFDVQLDGTSLQVGPVATRFSGKVGLSPSVSWSGLKVSTRQGFSVKALSALLPGEDLPVPDGRLSLTVSANGNLQRQKAQLKSQWDDFAYNQEGLSTRGQLKLDAQLSGAIQTPTFKSAVDLSSIQIQGDGFGKKASVPTKLNIGGRMTPNAIEVSEILLQLAQETITAQATYPLVSDQTIRFEMGFSQLKVNELMQAFQVPDDSVPKGTVASLAMLYKAPVSDPTKANVQLPKLSVRMGRSQINGTASVNSLEPIRAKFTANAPFLDLDALMPPTSDAPPPPPPEPSDGPLLPPSLTKAIVGIDVNVRRLRYQGVNISNVDVDLELRNGVLNIKKSTLGVLGGKLIGSGTRVDLSKTNPSYTVKAKVDKVQGGELINMFLGTGKALSGEMNSEVNLRGQGFDLAAIVDQLSGQMSFAFQKGRLNGVNLVAEALKPLDSALGFLDTNRLNLNTRLAMTEFRRLRGAFSIDDGRAKLRSPMVLSTPQGDITFTGGMAVDGKLALSADYPLTPSLIRTLTRGRVKVAKSLPLKFELGCSLSKPCVRGLDVKPTVAALTRAYAGKAIGNFAKPLTKKLGVDKKLQPEKLQPKNVEKEVQKRAKEAEERAKKKAEEAAKKALKGLFDR